VGSVFVWDLHLDQDCEASGNVAGKQRNEIKVYDPSPDKLKGFNGDSMSYSWKFRVDANMGISSKFTHIFQLKFVGGDDSDPMLTFTGENKNFQLLYQATGSSTRQALHQQSWSNFQNVWMQASVTVKIGTSGHLAVTIKRVDNGSTAVSWSGDEKTWRGGSNEFLRPKWGLYRSTEEPAGLNDARIQMADFCITKS
jgi:hypothetical protein